MRHDGLANDKTIILRLKFIYIKRKYRQIKLFYQKISIEMATTSFHFRLTTGTGNLNDVQNGDVPVCEYLKTKHFVNLTSEMATTILKYSGMLFYFTDYVTNIRYGRRTKENKTKLNHQIYSHRTTCSGWG